MICKRAAAAGRACCGLGKKNTWLLLTMHHIVSDGWSMGVLIDEVADALQGAYMRARIAAGGVADSVCGLCGVAAEWLQGEVLDEQLGYWRQRVGGSSACGVCRPTASAGSSDPRGANQPLQFSAELSAQLRELSRREA